MLVAAGTACRPIQHDYETGETSSAAVWRVRPIDMSRGDGIEIRFRHCNWATIDLPGDYPTIEKHLEPRAEVKDANGKVFFNTLGFAGDWIQPAGSRVVDNTSRGDDLQRIVIPVAGAKAPLTIESHCNSYPGYGAGDGFAFVFEPCVTSNRTCASTTDGYGQYHPYST
jgi:hypothetical protein